MMGLYIIQTMEILKVINLRDEIIEKERVSQRIKWILCQGHYKKSVMKLIKDDFYIV